MTKEKFSVLLSETDKIGDVANELSNLIEEYPYFHTGHMLYVRSLRHVDMEKYELQLSISALNVRDRGVLYDFLNDPVTEEETSQIESLVDENLAEIELPPSDVDKSPSELIEFFLKSDAKIKPNDSQYEADLSAGLQEDKIFFTETLADIYALQGHKDKAIEIYEQLILKNPEKHIYFAAQIKRLK